MTREIERLALRCLLPGFVGVDAPEWVLERAGEGLGGVILFARNVASPDQLRRLTDRLHRARPELVVGIDEEGGDVTRLEARTGSSYPGNWALGAVDDTALTGEVAAAIGADLSGAGIDLDLAPVVDVNTNPQNPIIGVRAFGSDAALVARHGAAWVAGLQSAGVAACAKHFPGHGDTSVDSHLALPVVAEDPHVRALTPFVAAIESGARAVMSAHIVVPAFDAVPATASRKIMVGILRDELGFDGVAITDGLEMLGFTPDGDVGEASVRALAAGCDALCVGGGLRGPEAVDRIVAAVAAAVGDGRLAEARLREAGARVDALAAWRASRPRASSVRAGVGLEAARLAVRADGDVRVGRDAAVLRFASPSSIAAGPVPWGMAAALRARGVRVHDVDVDVDDAAHDLDVVAGDARAMSLVLAVRDLHRHQGQAAAVGAIARRRPDAVLVEMGLPLCRPSAVRNYVATHGSARVCADAAAEAMAG